MGKFVKRVEGGFSGEVARKKRAVAVGALLGPLVEPALAKKGAVLAQLLPHWRAICPLLADYCFPEAVQGDVLVVAVDSDAVKQELLYITPQVLESINLLLGYPAVAKVRCKVQGTRCKVQGAREGARDRGLGRRSGVAAAEAVGGASDKVKQVCKGIADEALRTALEKLGARLKVSNQGES